MKTTKQRPARYRRLQPGLLLILLLASFLVHAGNSNHWQQVASQINASIHEAEAQYAAGNTKESRAAVVKAYFSQFEDSKMEAAMRTELGSQHTWQVEKSFGHLRKAIKKGASREEVAAIAEKIRAAIGEAAQKLDAAGISAQVFEVNQ